jgi:hypothetical protein
LRTINHSVFEKSIYFDLGSLHVITSKCNKTSITTIEKSAAVNEKCDNGCVVSWADHRRGVEAASCPKMRVSKATFGMIHLIKSEIESESKVKANGN